MGHGIFVERDLRCEMKLNNHHIRNDVASMCVYLKHCYGQS